MSSSRDYDVLFAAAGRLEIADMPSAGRWTRRWRACLSEQDSAGSLIAGTVGDPLTGRQHRPSEGSRPARPFLLPPSANRNWPDRTSPRSPST